MSNMRYICRQVEEYFKATTVIVRMERVNQAIGEYKIIITDVSKHPNQRFNYYIIQSYTSDRDDEIIKDIINSAIKNLELKISPIGDLYNPRKWRFDDYIDDKFREGFIKGINDNQTTRKEYNKMFKAHVFMPEIEKVIFNNPATIIFWNNGTKTIVKCMEGDTWDPEKGLAMAISKKYAEVMEINFAKMFKQYLPKEEVPVVGTKKGTIFGTICLDPSDLVNMTMAEFDDGK